MGEMLDVPSDPGGQRTVLIILVHGGEIPPLRIATGDFCHARFEVDAEPFPQKEKNGGTHGRARCAEPGTKPCGSEEERKEACFEEHTVRLIAGEFRGSGDEGKKTNEAG